MSWPRTPVADHPSDEEDGEELSPSQQDAFVRATSTALGGPVGRRARLGDRRWWTPLRVMVLLVTVVMSLGVMQKSSCATHGYGHEYQYTRVCYTDVLALWYGERLNEGKVPTLDNETPTPDPVTGKVTQTYVEYPVVISMLMAAVEGPVHLLVSDKPSASQQAVLDRFAQDQAAHVDPTSDPYKIDQYRANRVTSDYQTRRARYFYDLTALLLLLAAIATVVMTALTAGRRRIWDGAMVAVAPTLLLSGTVNWDLVAVAFTAGAMLAWARRRPALAGALLAAGVATKLYPLLLVFPLLALCLRAGRLRAFGRFAAAGVVTWLVVDVPFWIVSPTGFTRFYGLSRTRGTEYNSLFYAWQYFVWGANRFWDEGRATPTWLNFWEAILLLASVVAIMLLCLLAPRRPRLAQVAFLVVLAFLLTNKVFSPQYTLWLLPLAVLARPRWRAFLVWQATEVVLMITLYAHLVFVDTAGNAKPGGIGYGWFFGLGLAPRDLALLGLAGLVVWEIFHPERDVVRDGGADDPGGGVLDGAPDVFPEPWEPAEPAPALPPGAEDLVLGS